MKKHLIFLVLLTCLATTVYGLNENSYHPSGWVNDYAGIIDNTTNEKLTALITELKNKTGAEIAVVTIKSLEGDDLNDFTNRLFSKWGIGEKGKDNGVMLLIAYEDKKIRIETGYDIEGIIPDGKAGTIIRDDITPYFRQGDFSNGILAGVYSIATAIAADKGVTLTGGDYTENQQLNYKIKGSDIFWIIIFIIFVLPIIIRHPWLLLFFLFPGGGRGNYGDGFGGGGFGGFGGGSSGGGGASGGW